MTTQKKNELSHMFQNVMLTACTGLLMFCAKFLWDINSWKSEMTEGLKFNTYRFEKFDTFIKEEEDNEKEQNTRISNVEAMLPIDHKRKKNNNSN